MVEKQRAKKVAEALPQPLRPGRVDGAALALGGGFGALGLGGIFGAAACRRGGGLRDGRRVVFLTL
jgi:hypothetical protein